jgi:hypothetical protein
MEKRRIIEVKFMVLLSVDAKKNEEAAQSDVSKEKTVKTRRR